tara:strand:- start:2912 stop:3184 length:273 start_codon:yes stop_codon:yes gene_type:complete
VVAQPFSHKQIDNKTFLREFSETVDSNEMVWHRDRKDRYVKIIEGNGWKFQYDNKLPFSVYKNEQMFVPAGCYHRLIKGTSKLVVEISES